MLTIGQAVHQPLSLAIRLGARKIVAIDVARRKAWNSLVDSVRTHNVRVQLSTPMEIMARGVQDNVTSDFRNIERA